MKIILPTAKPLTYSSELNSRSLGMSCCRRHRYQYRPSARPALHEVEEAAHAATHVGRSRSFRSPHSSLKAFANWSVNGFARYEIAVRSCVATNTSTGMPGLRGCPASFSNSPGLSLTSAR